MGNIKIKRRFSRVVKLNKPDRKKKPRQQNCVTQRSWTVHRAGRERERKRQRKKETKREKERRKDRNKRFEWQAMRSYVC